MNGRQIAHFELGRKLGEGGMGVVYEALDQHLDRRVALKILPPDKLFHQSRKQRFIQEAKAASALNHPNIVTIYDISAADGVDYIAMELVAGQTLEELLAKRRLRLNEALQFAVQLADALATAHAAGIVHRDVKPANIMVTDNGLVKVLDFGLAKLTDKAEITEEDETQVAQAVTQEGTVLGSAGYMSPEQAEGKKVDYRSDIFSFGVVLYEMLSGSRAFQGATRMATIAAILNREPELLAVVAPGAPKEVERIVSRCLRKDLARRSQSMAEVKLALEELKEESQSGISRTDIAPQKASRARWRWAAAAGAMLALAAGSFFFLLRSRPPAELKETPLTAYTGRVRAPVLSPDGKQFAFVWNGGTEGGRAQIYVSLVGRGKPLRVSNHEETADSNPTWSPDGQTLAFTRRGRNGGLYLVPALGGVERRLDDAADYPAAWSPDGKWLYFSVATTRETAAIFIESSLGGEKRRLTDPPPEFSDFFPAISPDGRQIAFVRQQDVYNGDIYICDLRDGQVAGPARRLTSDRRTTLSPAWTEDGRDIVYAAGVGSPGAGGLTAIYRVPSSGGAASRVKGVGDQAIWVSVAPKANRLVYARSYSDFNLYRMELPSNGKPAGAPQKFLSSTRREATPSFSPDGSRIAFWSNRSGTENIWVADAAGVNPVQLTNFTSGVTGSPHWSPDGQTIVFDARPEGQSDIYSIRVDGGPPKRLTNHPEPDSVPRFSADGRWIFYQAHRSGEGHLYRVPAGGGEPVQMTQGNGSEPDPSPDGKWIYFARNHSLWKLPPEGGQEIQVLPPGALHASQSFTVRASGIYFIGPADADSHTFPLRLLRFADGKTVEVARLDRRPWLEFTVSPDEKQLVFASLDASVDEVMLVENFR